MRTGASHVEEAGDLTIGVRQERKLEVHHLRPTPVVIGVVIGDAHDVSVQLFESRSPVTELRPFEGSAGRVGFHIPPEHGPSAMPVGARDLVAVVVDRVELGKRGAWRQHAERLGPRGGGIIAGHRPMLLRGHQRPGMYGSGIYVTEPAPAKECPVSDERVTAKTFHDAGGLEDWRVLYWGAHAYFQTGSFARGARFVAAIAAISDAVGHFPDVDLRPDGVTVRTFTREDGALSQRDVELARRISETARQHDLVADPTQVQVVGIAVAQDTGADVRPFFTAVFGYTDLGGEDAVDAHRRNPHLWFHELEPPRAGRGRFHIDVSVPADQAEERVKAALAAGGRIADESHAPEWWTLASPENHGVDIAAWPDLEDYHES